MTPSWWQFVLLALAAYRLTRLAGWDDFPLALKARAWAAGARWEEDPFLRALVEAMARPVENPGVPTPVIPGPTPTVTSDEEPKVVYDRPLVAHLLSCPFCVGWWISLAMYGCWLTEARWTLYAAVPFALSGVVGLVAKNLDA